MNQLNEYNQIWDRYKNSSETVLNDLPSLKKENTTSDYSLTFTFVLPSEIQQKIFDLSERIQISFPEQYYLPRNYYHMSLSYLTTYNKDDNPTLVKETIEKYKRFLREKIPTFPEITLEIKGINHFKNCVFAQVWDKGETLFSLNKAIQTEFQIQSEFSFVPHIAMIYYKTEPHALFKFIETNLRDIPIGEVTMTTVSLLRWSLHRENDYKAYEILEQNNLRFVNF